MTSKQDAATRGLSNEPWAKKSGQPGIMLLAGLRSDFKGGDRVQMELKIDQLGDRS